MKHCKVRISKSQTNLNGFSDSQIIEVQFKIKDSEQTPLSSEVEYLYVSRFGGANAFIRLYNQKEIVLHGKIRCVDLGAQS